MYYPLQRKTELNYKLIMYFYDLCLVLISKAISEKISSIKDKKVQLFF